MGWNYRIVRWVEAPDGTEAFGLHEASFDAQGRVYAITEEPVGAVGDTRDEVIACLQTMLKDAQAAPVLDAAKVPEPGAGERPEDRAAAGWDDERGHALSLPQRAGAGADPGVLRRGRARLPLRREPQLGRHRGLRRSGMVALDRGRPFQIFVD